MTLARRRVALLCILGSLAACRAGPPSVQPPSERSYVDPGSGLSFLVPATWVESVAGDAVVLSGPEGTDAYYTTLVLQVADVAAAPLELDAALDRTYERLHSEGAPEFLSRTPALVAGSPAVRYLVKFDYAERPRLRTGVVVADGATTWHLAYTAPPELFASGIDVFERALDTVTRGPGDGGSP